MNLKFLFKITFLLLFLHDLLLVTSITSAQEKVNSQERLTYTIAPEDTIYINLEGVIYLDNSNENILKTIAYFQKKGRYFGLTNGKIEPYGLIIERLGRSIHVRPAKRKKLNVYFGYTNYSETYIHYLSLPEFAHIVLKSNKSKIFIDGNYSYLEVSNKTGDTEVNFNPGRWRHINGFSPEGTIKFDLSNYTEPLNYRMDKHVFVMSDTGESTLLARSRKGKIEFKIK